MQIIQGQPSVVVSITVEFVENGVRRPSILKYAAQLDGDRLRSVCLKSATYVPDEFDSFDEVGEAVLQSVGLHAKPLTEILNRAEMEFVEAVVRHADCKYPLGEDRNAYYMGSEESEWEINPVWKRPVALGLVSTTGSWRWVPGPSLETQLLKKP